jgi:steroid delta-isomerase-like uncharacterized protein
MSGFTPGYYETLAHRLYEDGFNTGHLDLLREILAEDFVGPRGERGPAAMAQSVAPLRAGFPDMRFTIDDVFASGDESNMRVTVRWTMRGTHTGPFGGVPASGRPVVQSAVAIYTCAGGKFTRLWLMNDRLALLYQIGALPSVPAAVEAILKAQIESAAVAA